MDNLPPRATSVNHSPSTTVSGNFFSDFQTDTQSQVLQLDRMVADVRETIIAERKKIEEQSRTSVAVNENIKILEGKIVNLQKIVAKQADDYKKLERDSSSQIAALQLELETQKQYAQTLGRQVEEIRRRNIVGAGASGYRMPENILQMFEALERQLGLYDVKIAENDIRFQVVETTNYDGRLVWKIADFARRREDGRRNKTLSLYSQPFYTARYGYKMCLRIYLNGDGIGKNTHISLFFVVMKGEYDATLSFPFRKKVTLTLLNQDPTGRHRSGSFRPFQAIPDHSDCFQRPTSDMNRQYGSAKFISHEEINESSYIKDDTIFIRAPVEADEQPEQTMAAAPRLLPFF